MKTYQRQVHGARAKAKPVDDPGTPEDESKGNSVSHQSYVQTAEAGRRSRSGLLSTIGKA